MLLGKLSEDSKKLFFQLEMLLASIDGAYDASEKELIEKHCKEMEIVPDNLEADVSLDEVIKGINAKMSVQEKKIIFIELLTVAVVDGIYDDREKKLVDAVEKTLGIPEEVGNQALELVTNLVKVSTEIQNFVEW